VDPLGGSYAIEALTDEIERHAGTYIGKIDAMGGMLRAIESGYVQREIQQAAYEYQRAVETGERVVVGVNRYAVPQGAAGSALRLRSGPAAPLLRIDLETERAQVERLRRLRARRDRALVEAALARIETTARSDENLMPAIFDAVKCYATVGEISNALRKVFGEYQESVVI